MYAIRTGDYVADAQIGALSGAEVQALLELYDVLRLTPGNGVLYVEGGNTFTWAHKGLLVTYFVLEEQREVVVLRVDRFPVLGANKAPRYTYAI